MNSKHAIGIHGFVLVYSVTSRNSFDMIQIVYDKIINFCGESKIPCVIVGSKADLEQKCVVMNLATGLVTDNSPTVDKSVAPKARSWHGKIMPSLSRPAQRITSTLVSALR